jgi:hypothetical protein
MMMRGEKPIFTAMPRDPSPRPRERPSTLRAGRRFPSVVRFQSVRPFQPVFRQPSRSHRLADCRRGGPLCGLCALRSSVKASALSRCSVALRHRRTRARSSRGYARLPNRKRSPRASASPPRGPLGAAPRPRTSSEARREQAAGSGSPARRLPLHRRTAVPRAGASSPATSLLWFVSYFEVAGED